MAQRIQVLLVCDLHDEEVEGSGRGVELAAPVEKGSLGKLVVAWQRQGLDTAGRNKCPQEVDVEDCEFRG